MKLETLGIQMFIFEGGNVPVGRHSLLISFT